MTQARPSPSRLLQRLRAALADSAALQARTAAQTAAAVAAVYLVAEALELDHLSWAVISALFTIGISADATYRNALGRIAGTALGVVLGLAATVISGHSILIALVLATTVANVVASIRPGLRYAAVVAAVIALEGRLEAVDTMQLAFAIVVGAIAGSAAGLLVWPVFSRTRTRSSLRAALGDCRRLIGLIEAGIATDDHHERDEVHARFLGHLEHARARLSETDIRPWLPSGVPLRTAVEAVERLWHALVMLDRAVTDERSAIRADVLDRLRALMDPVHHEAGRRLDHVRAAMERGDADPAASDRLDAAIAAVRAEIDAVSSGDAVRRDELRALNVLAFALDETASQIAALGELGRQPQAS